jgi:multiple sugar transport system substrate-binding protein
VFYPIRRSGPVFARLLVIGLVALASCRPALLDPPRQATNEAQQALTPTPSPTAWLLDAPEPTGTRLVGEPTPTTVLADPNRLITLWVNETSAEHNRVLREMSVDFTSQSGIQVELILVAPDRLPGLVSSAVLSNTLPDLILHPLEYTVGWAEQGVLDAEAATTVVEELGRESFDQNALDLVALEPAEGEARIAALPSDGWQQLVIFRQDWYDSLNLPPPVSYQRIISASEVLYDLENRRSGLVVPTESDLVSTQQVFEHIAIANGCQIIDEKGEVLILEEPCRQALDYYRRLINQFSPSDVQTDLSALNAYLAGRTGLIVASPSVLPRLAGLDPEHPPACPECGDREFLARNSGILTRLEGSGREAAPANFGVLTYLGITSSADEQAALAFARYWFEDGYLRWLSVEPERKAPLRLGTAGSPTQYLDAWGTLPLLPDGPSLQELYGDELVTQLSSGAADSPRWGFRQRQGAFITTMYEELLMSIVLQEMLSGYFNSEETAIEAYKRLIALIPEYAYTVEFEPTPTPEP